MGTGNGAEIGVDIKTSMEAGTGALSRLESGLTWRVESTQAVDLVQAKPRLELWTQAWTQV